MCVPELSDSASTPASAFERSAEPVAGAPSGPVNDAWYGSQPSSTAGWMRARPGCDESRPALVRVDAQGGGAAIFSVGLM